jgi:altronate hydrolase
VIVIPNVLRIHRTDNVGVALAPLAPGETVEIDGSSLTVREAVPVGHKLALEEIAAGAAVRKYGFTIGNATRPVRPGEWLHSHNLATALHDKLEYRYEPSFHEPEPLSGAVPTFRGYRRRDGRVGVRNEIWIVNTVGCINQQSERLAELARSQYQPQIATGRIDGIYAFSHPYGCSQLGEDLRNTQKLLAGLVRHPNAAGVLVVGLGCENNQMADFQKVLGPVDPDRVKFLILQEVADELAVGLQLLGELVDFAGAFQPEPVPVSELTIGLKCGGSDGFSGITANPLVGAVADRLIEYGGTAILSEVPEMFGAETILMNRAKDQATFEKVVALINDFKDYFIRNGQEVYENPSPGNKDGGITTLEDKSLGCTQKGGTSIVTDVIRYGERSTVKGLNLLEGPGNDIVSCTALAAAGAQLILFTTGRGNPMGAIVPTIKVSTNSRLAQGKPHWIDFNAGRLLEGSTMAGLRDEFFEYLLAVASKERLTRNEQNGYRDMAIFKSGVTL